MTFEDAFKRHLAVVNACYGEYFKLIADPQFNNRFNSDWRRAEENLKDAIDVVQRLKSVWLESGEVPRHSDTAGMTEAGE